MRPGNHGLIAIQTVIARQPEQRVAAALQFVESEIRYVKIGTWFAMRPCTKADRMRGCRRRSANLCRGKSKRNFFTECLTLPEQITLNRDRPESHQIIPTRFKKKRVTRAGLAQRGSGKNGGLI